ncbi:hypothetical protein TRVL_02590 [Trypanosoma vivax]|nr:hypothetical protein TRVL_02590 [Trypanosoma vivax]
MPDDVVCCYRQPIQTHESPSEFITCLPDSALWGSKVAQPVTQTENEENEEENSNGTGATPLSASSGNRCRLNLPLEWTFTLSQMPCGGATGTATAEDITKGGNEADVDMRVMVTSRLDYVLHTWSMLTRYIVSSDFSGGLEIGFFPAKLPANIVSWVAGGRGDKAPGRAIVYHEVRARVPVKLFHGISVDAKSEPDKSEFEFGDSLEHFFTTRRLDAELLRMLIHDAVVSCVSGSSPFTCGFEQLSPRTVSEASYEVALTDGDSVDGHNSPNALSTVESRSHCHLIPRVFHATPPPPTPVVFSISATNYDKALSTTQQNRSLESEITLLLQVVVRAVRHQHSSPQEWAPERVAFEALTTLFPERFAIHGATCVEIAEVTSSIEDDGNSVKDKGPSCLWRRLSVSDVIEAGVQLRTVNLSPLLAFDGKSATGTRANSTGEFEYSGSGIRTQHNPYGWVATETPRSALSSSAHSLDHGRPSCSRDHNVGKRGNTLCNSIPQVKNECMRENDFGISKRLGASMREALLLQTSEASGEDASTGAPDPAHAVWKELLVKETSEKILSLIESIVDAWRQSSQLISGLQHLHRKLIKHSLRSAVAMDTPQLRRKGRNSKGNSSPVTIVDEIEGATKLIMAALGVNLDSWDDVAAALQRAALERSALADSDTTATNNNNNNTAARHYSSFEEGVKDAIDALRQLDHTLRAGAQEVRYAAMDPKKCLNGGVVVKSERKAKKEPHNMFGFAVRALLKGCAVNVVAPRGTLNNVVSTSKHPNGNDGCTADVVSLRFTEEGYAEAQSSIKAACDRLCAIGDLGHRYVTLLRSFHNMYSDVILPYMEMRYALQGSEEKKSSELRVDFIVSTAVVREAQGNMQDSCHECQESAEEVEEMERDKKCRDAHNSSMEVHETKNTVGSASMSSAGKWENKNDVPRRRDAQTAAELLLQKTHHDTNETFNKHERTALAKDAKPQQKRQRVSRAPISSEPTGLQEPALVAAAATVGPMSRAVRATARATPSTSSGSWLGTLYFHVAALMGVLCFGLAALYITRS